MVKEGMVYLTFMEVVSSVRGKAITFALVAWYHNKLRFFKEIERLVMERRLFIAAVM